VRVRTELLARRGKAHRNWDRRSKVDFQGAKSSTPRARTRLLKETPIYCQIGTQLRRLSQWGSRNFLTLRWASKETRTDRGSLISPTRKRSQTRKSAKHRERVIIRPATCFRLWISAPALMESSSCAKRLIENCFYSREAITQWRHRFS
jgi:hypothetical protein